MNDQQAETNGDTSVSQCATIYKAMRLPTGIRLHRDGPKNVTSAFFSMKVIEFKKHGRSILR